MRSRIGLLVLAWWLGMSAAALAARDEYDDSQSHPLRVAAYLIHPAGVALEWAIYRPLHYLVSASPETEMVFGHTPHGAEEIPETPDTSPTLGARY